MPPAEAPFRPLAFDLRAAVGRPTGVGRYLLAVANAASAAGWVVHGYVRREVPTGLERGIRRVRIGAAGDAWHLGAWIELRRSRAVFVSTSFIVPQLPGILALPAVLDVTTFLLPEFHTMRTRLAERLLLPRALRRWPVVTCTQTSAADIQSHFAEAGPVSVVPPPCAVAGAATPTSSQESDPYFAFVGTLEPRKNVALIIDATRRLRRVGHRIRLVVAGNAGWHFDQLKAALQLAQREGAVEWRGYVSDDERDEIYRNAVALLLPSHYEGFGLPLLEAMAEGVPTICSDTPALVEVAAGSALHAPATDVAAWVAQMERLMREPDLRQRLAGRGIERAREFTPEATLRGLRSALQNLAVRGG